MPNTLYLADLLEKEYPAVYGQIALACAEFGQELKPIPHTRDIWVRDFMPVVLPDGSLLEYRYDPDYLQGIGEDTRGSKSYPDFICQKMGLSTTKTDIILDGGNAIRQGKTLIMTEKVLHENRSNYTSDELETELKKRFQVDKIVFIAWDPDDEYGHADSMLRFIDENTVLVNYYYKGYSRVTQPLKKAGFNLHFLKFTNIKAENDRYWPYLNFVQTDKLMLYTAIDEHYDKEAKEQFEELFPAYKGRMRGIHMPELIKQGGALHCISWVV
ncbi:MAG: agmatine deiminase family protein [Bacteroidia bacterium]